MVYIDKARNPLGRMLMSHMIADTKDELHDMAKRLNLRREWFQDGSKPHYDISQSKKTLALSLGAIEVTERELVRLLK